MASQSLAGITDMEPIVEAARKWMLAEDAAADERRAYGLYAPSQLVSQLQVAAVTARRELRELLGGRPDA
jgi:hypothetical protein